MKGNPWSSLKKGAYTTSGCQFWNQFMVPEQKVDLITLLNMHSV